MAKAGPHYYSGNGNLAGEGYSGRGRAGWHQTVLVPYFGTLCRTAGGEETSTLLHFEFGNTLTLCGSIWGGLQAKYLGWPTSSAFEETQAQLHPKQNNCRHLTAYYTSLKGSHCLATLCTTILPHMTIMPHILMTSADKGTTLCPCVTSLHIAPPGTGWFPLSQCHHSPNITNALFTAF